MKHVPRQPPAPRGQRADAPIPTAANCCATSSVIPSLLPMTKCVVATPTRASAGRSHPGCCRSAGGSHVRRQRVGSTAQSRSAGVGTAVFATPWQLSLEAAGKSLAASLQGCGMLEVGPTLGTPGV
jgi:hypothetical protein